MGSNVQEMADRRDFKEARGLLWRTVEVKFEEGVGLVGV